MKRTVFFLSDRTGITAETLAHCLLTQFRDVAFIRVNIPYIDSIEKAQAAVAQINRQAALDENKPLLFSTLVDPGVRNLVRESNGFLVDFFDAFINPLEAELGVASAHASGRSHGVGSYSDYKMRIDAVNFALSNDDGATTKYYDDAEVIVIGVSRCGKTPTCLYLALNYGLFAANYPLTEEDLNSDRLPAELFQQQHKLFGLTIDPERLQQIRSERRPNTRYATLAQCKRETRGATIIYQKHRIPHFDTSAMSIEEIATTIMHRMGLKRRLYG